MIAATQGDRATLGADRPPTRKQSVETHRMLSLCFCLSMQLPLRKSRSRADARRRHILSPERSGEGVPEADAGRGRVELRRMQDRIHVVHT
jgi:hypothetical protein